MPHMSAPSDLEKSAARLNALRSDLAERLARLKQSARRAGEPLSADFAEQAVERENDDVVDRLREATVAELASVSRALARVADGTYGRCLRCGEDIEPARLQALPASAYCAACQGLNSAR
jgi:RNA polymerase-binding transcription factor DksA